MSRTPLLLTPKHPTLVREPFARAGWVYEEKLDGWRVVLYKDGARVRITFRLASTLPAGSRSRIVYGTAEHRTPWRAVQRAACVALNEPRAAA